MTPTIAPTLPPCPYPNCGKIAWLVEQPIVSVDIYEMTAAGGWHKNPNDNGPEDGNPDIYCTECGKYADQLGTAEGYAAANKVRASYFDSR